MEQPTKMSLRAGARTILTGLSEEARAAASAEIRRRIVALPEWLNAGTVALFAAQNTEPDLISLVDAGGKRFCFPRVSGDALEFHQCDSKSDLVPGRWGLLEPDATRRPVIGPAEIDLLLIPGLAFTRTGGRLGRGGGFYDRFLESTRPRAVKIGVCFHAQIVPTLPLEMHDHEVDAVVSEAEVIRRG